MVPDSISLARLFNTSGVALPIDGSFADGGLADAKVTDAKMTEGDTRAPDAAVNAGSLTVGLVDCYRFSQECLVKAFEAMHPRLTIVPFATVQECTLAARADLDLVVYYAHVADSSDASLARDLAALRQGLRSTPLIVMSDAEDAQRPDTIRNTLNSGARGFIPTRTMGLPITFAVMRFVKAGGTFAPLDLLLGEPAEPAAAAQVEATPKGVFTSRQVSVLLHLKQGKANKTIAHELGMSESTVKVHVRNIMRTMGATNRTQAAYKAQQLWNGLDHAQPADQ